MSRTPLGILPLITEIQARFSPLPSHLLGSAVAVTCSASPPYCRGNRLGSANPVMRDLTAFTCRLWEQLAPIDGNTSYK